MAVVAAVVSDDNSSGGNYSLGVAPNTELRIRVKAHMQQTGAGGPRWDVKVTDNTSRNALYTFQGDLRSSGTGASTRNLHAPSGWVPSGSAGRYAESRVAAPFAILSFTWDAVQKFVAVDPDVNVPALEYRWSIRNRSATARDLADGAIRSSFYQGGPKVNGAAPANSVIYLLGRENENTEEYDQTVVMHEFAHHVAWAMSREDSTGGRHNRNALLDMRVAFSEGFKRAFVKVSFAQSGAHTLTMTTAAGSRAANPRFRWPPYRGIAQRRSTSQWASAPRSATITGNFRAGEPLVLDAFDEQNTDSVTDNDGDSCFTFSVVKN